MILVICFLFVCVCRQMGGGEGVGYEGIVVVVVLGALSQVGARRTLAQDRCCEVRGVRLCPGSCSLITAP